MNTSKVYILTDDKNRIIRCEGGYTTPNPLTTDWVQIDDGTGDKYNLCQSHYFPDGLYTPDGIPRYKLQDGSPVERTQEEIAADLAAMPAPEPGPQEQMQAAVRLARMQAQALPDAQALEVPELYPAWAAGADYAARYIVSRPNGHLYRCQQGHASQEGWEPENTPALWVVIANGEAGSQDDPITAARGMEYTYGLYYLDPEDGKTYLCSRIGETEGGKITLQYLPHELVGQYFSET